MSDTGRGWKSGSGVNEDMDAMKVYLVGFMGAGKSTVAPILAEKLDLDWVDTDELVEEREGLTIPEIFDYYGEDRFREIEREVIKEVSRSGPKVIAVGGGAPMDRTNWSRMKSSGEVVYLEIGPKDVFDRIGSDESRPLISGLKNEKKLEKIVNLLKVRHPQYNRADHVVLSNGAGVRDLAAEITDKLTEDNESR